MNNTPTTMTLLALFLLTTSACSDQNAQLTTAISDQSDQINTLTQRIADLEAREDIRALILAYGKAHDHRDYRTYASLFAEEGEWVSGMGTATGPDAIFAFLDDAIGHNPLPEGSGTYHIMTNEQIDVDGDRASANTKWIYITKSPDNTPYFFSLGHYIDEFIRVDGEWKFQRRESIREIPGE